MHFALILVVKNALKSVSVDNNRRNAFLLIVLPTDLCMFWLFSTESVWLFPLALHFVLTLV